MVTKAHRGAGGEGSKTHCSPETPSSVGLEGSGEVKGQGVFTES